MKAELPHEGPRGTPRKPVRRLRCGAKARTNGGKPCRRWALAGKVRCRLHGGKNPTGPANGNWKHGAYSSVMPRDVADLARRAKNDPTLQDMREQIGLVDVRIMECLGDLNRGAGDWNLVTDALNRLQSAGDDLNAARKALDDIRAAATDGRTRVRAWVELRELFQERDKLMTGEVNRHKATADTIPADRVANFMVGMIDALREESEDRELVRRVLARWERLMGLAGVMTPIQPDVTRIP